MVAADSRRVSRAPRYSGTGFESRPLSPTRLSRSVASLSREVQLAAGLVTLLLPGLQPPLHPNVRRGWGCSSSLATAFRLTIFFFSSRYLDRYVCLVRTRPPLGVCGPAR